MSPKARQMTALQLMSFDGVGISDDETLHELFLWYSDRVGLRDLYCGVVLVDCSAACPVHERGVANDTT